MNRNNNRGTHPHPNPLPEGEGEVTGPRCSGGRLPVATVLRLHRVLEGDVRVEGMILRFIAEQYGAKDLMHLPAHVAEEILKRPGDFLRAAKNHCEPELRF